MYFLPQNNALYAVLVSIKPRYRYWITVALILGVACGWFFGIYIPIQTKINQYNHEIAELKQQELFVRRLPRLMDELQSTVDSLEQIQQSLCPSPVTIQDLLQWMEHNHVRCAACSLQKEFKQKKQAGTVIQCTMVGTLSNVAAFFSLLTRKSILYSLDSWSVRRERGDIFSVQCGMSFT